jgi:tetratricopeptide (TPR) repeat protein
MSQFRNLLDTLLWTGLLLAFAFAVWASPASGAPAPGSRTTLAGNAAPLFDDLGNHHRKVTTRSEQAQRYFDQGLTLLYAFNHAEAIRSFREAARLDPDCAMVWWGIALGYGPNINKPMAAEDNPKAWEAVQKAKELAPKASEQERAYIGAVSKRYAHNPPEDRSKLDWAYADAMRELARQYPDDLDAAVLFAESLMDLSPWDYWTKEARPKPETQEILAALERVMKANPDHPGANHYYVHAVEAVEPRKALGAADRLLHFAPGAGHLVHMPAHIYLRLGMYHEAAVANELASRADQSYIAQCNAQGFYPATYYPHNMHFLWYTHAMVGRSAASVAAARDIASHGGQMKLSEAERLQPLLSAVLVRFGRWDEVLAQPRPPEERRFETAMSHWARGLALAATGRTGEAESEFAALDAIAQDEKTKSLQTPILPGETLVRLARHDLAGHLALKKGRHAEAVKQLEAAVALEDGLPYMEPPFSYIPMRHGLGTALLAAGSARDAEAVYREDLKRNPNNGWSLFGLSQSLRAQGKAEAADEAYRAFEQAWVRADIKLTTTRY